MPFLRALVWSKIQTASPKIWTWVVNFIFSDKAKHNTSVPEVLGIKLIKRGQQN